MAETNPTVTVLGGPNGAGKSTIADVLLPAECQIREFVNADVIARGLAAYDPEGVALQAGRIMLERLHELAADRRSFAFETTLSARTFAGWLRTLKRDGYRFRLVYVWLESSDLAIQRVAARVQRGGHDIPSDVVRRRYERSLSNLFELYMPLADDWEIVDNSHAGLPTLVAQGGSSTQTTVIHHDCWNQIVGGRRL